MDFLSLFGSLLSFLLLYKYVALFALIFLAGIGFPIPSNTLLIAVGAFASQHYFNFGESLLIAVVANILGDLVGYLLMRKYGRSIIESGYHKKFSIIVKLEKYIVSLEKYIRNHERMAIFITRFLGSASTIINFLAGLIPVPWKTFVMYDALGNFLNIFGIMLLGFFVSESWQKVASIIGTVSATISILIVVVLIIFLIKKFRKSRNIS